MAIQTIAAVGAASARALAIRALGMGAVRHAVGLESDEEKEQPLSFSVSSSAISHLAWKDETITVTFNRGGVYDYPGSRDLFMDFVQAPSIGQYFNQHIRPLG